MPTPHGTATVYRWEVEKLATLLRVRLTAAACFPAPFAFAAALRLQDAVPRRHAVRPPDRAAVRVLAAWTAAVPPTPAFTAMGVLFSVATRNGPAGILGPSAAGLVMQLLTFVNGVDVVRHLLPRRRSFDEDAR